MDLDATPDGDLWAVGRVLGEGRHASVAERLCPSRPSSDGFDPDVVTAPYGSGVAWSVPAGDEGSYRLVDGTGLELFDSGDLTATATFTQRFAAAGTYTVSESTSDTVQTIRLRPTARARPRLGAGIVKVTWAFGSVPAGLVVDVQIRRPGTGVWRTVAGGSTERSAFFTVDPGAGRYGFRSRLRDPTSGAASDWSPPAHITVA
jgi:hypothetical protein